MAHSIAEHRREVRLGDLQTMRELVQELSRMESRLRESRAQQVIDARSPQLIHEEKNYPSDIDMFFCGPPEYGPALVSPQCTPARDDLPRHSVSPPSQPSLYIEPQKARSITQEVFRRNQNQRR